MVSVSDSALGRVRWWFQCTVQSHCTNQHLELESFLFPDHHVNLHFHYAFLVISPHRCIALHQENEEDKSSMLPLTKFLCESCGLEVAVTITLAYIKLSLKCLYIAISQIGGVLLETGWWMDQCKPLMSHHHRPVILMIIAFLWCLHKLRSQHLYSN